MILPGMKWGLSVAAFGIGMTVLAAAQQTPSVKVLRFGHLWNGLRLIVDAKDDFGFAPETIPPLQSRL